MVDVSSEDQPLSATTEIAEVEKDIRDLATAALVSFVGKVSRLSRGLFIWVVTLLFGLEIQGLYSLSWGIVTVLNKIGRFGLQRGVVYFVVPARAAGDEEGVERAIAGALVIGLLASSAIVVLVVLSADLLADFYKKPIAMPLRIMIGSAPFMMAAWVFVGATQALRIMRIGVYVMSIAGPLILLVGGIMTGILELGLVGIAWAQFGMAVGSCLFATFYFRRFFSLSNCLHQVDRKSSWKMMGKFSLPVMLTDLLYGILTQLDVLMLGWFVTEDKIYLIGIYVLARRLASVMLKTGQAFDPIFSSIISELSSQKKMWELENRFIIIFRWILIINLPFFAGILLVGDSLIVQLIGGQLLALSPNDLEIGVDILLLLCIGMTIQGLFSIIEPLLAMSGHPGMNLVNNAIWLVTNFASNFWLISIYGIKGAAIGAFFSLILVNFIRLLQLYRLYEIHPFSRSQLKPVAAVLGGGLVGILVRSELAIEGLWNPLLSLSALLATYSLLLRGLGFEIEERMLLQRVEIGIGRLINRSRRER